MRFEWKAFGDENDVNVGQVMLWPILTFISVQLFLAKCDESFEFEPKESFNLALSTSHLLSD